MSANELVFGKYEIQHRLAIGGMGEVFYALQRGIPGFERPAILKSLLPDLAAQPGLVDQFLDEARVAATLNHPNVVSIYEVGQWNGTYFIAMEYIRGRNLAQLVRRAAEAGVSVPPWVAGRIIADAASGLHHAHTATDAQGQALNVIHRDISPQNIMLRDDGVTKVVDFGIASASNRATRTATGQLKGKLAYMAPEQILSEPLTPAADQFALGVCFWEILTGSRLFKAELELKILEKVLHEPIAAPSELRSDHAATFDDIVLRMLNRDTRQRFASCADVAAAIQQRLAEAPGSRELSPAAFMRQLGTDDLTLSVKRTGSSSGNFVISLNSNAPATPGPEVRTATTPFRPAPLGETPPQKGAGRRGAIVAGAVVVALLAAAGALWALKPPEVVPPPPAVEVAGPPSEPPPKPDTPPPPEVPPAPVHFKVVSVPQTVLVRFDGKPVGETPVTIDASPDETHYLQAERAGYQRLEKEVSGTSGQVQRVELVLQKVKLSPVKTGPAPSTEPGYLSLDTRPWSKVSIDGEYVGSTPLFKRKLAPGSHRLLLVNEGDGVRVTRDITVKAGETLKLNLPLK